MSRSDYASVQAVVFDLDGTLLDNIRSAPLAYAESIRHLGGPVLSIDDVIAHWHIGPAPAVLAYFLGRTVNLEDVECYYRELEAVAKNVRPFAGVVNTLEVLGNDGYRLGVFTSATRRAATFMLAAAGLDRYLNTIVCGDDIDKPKPHHEGLWRVCQQLGVTPAQTIYVGDADVDLQCARAAGAVGIHARWSTASTMVRQEAVVVAAHPHDVISLLRGQHNRNVKSES